jgi:N-formylglutamate deformylase
MTTRGTRRDRRWLIPPGGRAVPLIACLPHGGREFPAGLAGDLAVAPDGLWSDWLTRELYAFLPELGVTTIVTSLSRYVADVNRDPAGEQHGGFWTSVVPAQTPTGQQVYHRPLTAAQIGERLRIAHEPFHRALDGAVAGLLRRFSRLLLLDLHSFGLPELDADVILGDRYGATARPEPVRLLTAALASLGFSVRHNERFTGGWTVRRFAGQDRVDAVQVELNQRCYLNVTGHTGATQPPAGDFDAARRRRRTVLEDHVIPALTAPGQRT